MSHPSIQCRCHAMWSSCNVVSLKHIPSFDCCPAAARLLPCNCTRNCTCNCTPREGLTQDTPRTRQMKLGAIVHGL